MLTVEHWDSIKNGVNLLLVKFSSAIFLQLRPVSESRRYSFELLCVSKRIIKGREYFMYQQQTFQIDKI